MTKRIFSLLSPIESLHDAKAMHDAPGVRTYRLKQFVDFIYDHNFMSSVVERTSVFS